MSVFRYSDDNKRYHTLSYHNRHTYGARVYKAVIDAGLSCPNADGTRGTGGCIFCDGGSGFFTADSRLSITEQLALEERRIRAKHSDAKILAYFQAHTNTYCSPERLERMLSEAEDYGAFAISVATRADCLDEEKVRILSRVGIPLTVELGLQTAHDSTARKINRCHTFADFLQGYSLLKRYGIRVCVHIINGLPDEDEGMMLQTAQTLGALRPDGVKIHLLHVISGTPLDRLYKSGGYIPMEKRDYIDTVVRQLELLPAETVIERVTGDGNKSRLVAPLWSADKLSVLVGIDKRQRELDTWQGKCFSED